MIVVLGIAFNNQKAETFEVLVLPGRGAEKVLDDLAADPRLHPSMATASEARDRLRTGKAMLLVTPQERLSLSDRSRN